METFLIVFFLVLTALVLIIPKNAFVRTGLFKVTSFLWSGIKSRFSILSLLASGVIILVVSGFFFWFHFTKSSEEVAKVSYATEGIKISFNALADKENQGSKKSRRIELLDDIEIWSGSAKNKLWAVLKFDGTLKKKPIRGSVGSSVSEIFADLARKNPDEYYDYKKGKARGHINAYSEILFDGNSNEIWIFPAVEDQEVFFSKTEIRYRIIPLPEEQKKESKK